MAADDSLQDLRRAIARDLGLDFENHSFKLACRTTVLADDDACVSELPSPRVMVVVQKLATVGMLEPEIPGGDGKYWAAGVLAPNGCIYFAPCHAAKVLSIDS